MENSSTRSINTQAKRVRRIEDSIRRTRAPISIALVNPKLALEPFVSLKGKLREGSKIQN